MHNNKDVKVLPTCNIWWDAMYSTLWSHQIFVTSTNAITDHSDSSVLAEHTGKTTKKGVVHVMSEQISRYGSPASLSLSLTTHTITKFRSWLNTLQSKIEKSGETQRQWQWQWSSLSLSLTITKLRGWLNKLWSKIEKSGKNSTMISCTLDDFCVKNSLFCGIRGLNWQS